MPALRNAVAQLVADHCDDFDCGIDAEVVGSESGLLDRLTAFASRLIPEGSDTVEWAKRRDTWVTLKPEVVRLARGS